MRTSRFVCALAAILWLASGILAQAAPKKPKLVLAIVFDQFRYDYLTRFRSEYNNGFERLMTRGAFYSSAQYIHFPTVTAAGHSTFLTGATPALSGIIGNEWFDRKSGRNVTSVSDPTVRELGGTADGGASPRRMLVSTVGDELRMAHPDSRVVGISLKDRAAILPSGHMANGAYWFDGSAGSFVSSTFYFSDLPAWVKDFNAGRPADRYRGAVWLNHRMPEEAGPRLYQALPASPFGNELVEALAEHALRAERLGQRAATDVLTVSFSSNDYIGHAYGPDSPEVREISVRSDRLLGKLLDLADSLVGAENVLVVMTADHGVAPVPEVQEARKMPGGRQAPRVFAETVGKALTARYGDGKWISNSAESWLYLNQDLIRQKGLDPAEVRRVAAGAVDGLPHVFRVYTRDQIRHGGVLDDPVDRRVMNGFFARRSGDVLVLLDPYWIFGTSGTTHGSPFGYDTHVPVLFMGPGIRPGRYYENITVNDIAPTLAALLDIDTPSGSVGRVLSEMFAERTVAVARAAGSRP